MRCHYVLSKSSKIKCRSSFAEPLFTYQISHFNIIQHDPLIAPIIIKIKIQPLTIAPNIPKMTLIDI